VNQSDNAGEYRCSESDAQNSEAGPLAGDLLGVRVEQRFSQIVRVLMFIPLLIVGAIRVLFFWGQPEIAHPCAVVLYRKSDGVELLRYDYRFASEAYEHLAYIVGRLATDSVVAIYRDFGIDDSELHKK
jgi:hypothetical protein